MKELKEQLEDLNDEKAVTSILALNSAIALNKLRLMNLLDLKLLKHVQLKLISVIV
jgi:hypothetical protein